MTELKPIKCKAAILYEVGKPMVVEDVLIDAPKGDQVRIKMISAGICGSDGHILWGEFSLRFTPNVLGHEGLGVVESVGEEVGDIKPGDVVMSNIMGECGKCANCKSPLTNYCAEESIGAFSTSIHKRKLDGSDVYSFVGMGVYSEYVTLKISQVVKVDPSLNRDSACIISCAVATGFYAATNQANVQPNTTVAVWGMGAIGLNAVFGSKHNGAKNIIGIDTNSDKKQIALEFGATEFINPKELEVPLEEYIKQKYGGLDYAIECIGNQSVIETAFKCLTVYGTLALVGVDEKTVLSLPLLQLLSGKKVVGAFLGNKKPHEGFVELSKMYLAGQYDIDRLVTHRFKLEQINEAFQTLREGKCIRSIIVFDH